MGIGVSVFLIALGAVLAFAVNVDTTGVDLPTVGIILMIVGAIGLVTTLLLFGDGGWRGRRTIVETDVVDDVDVPVATRRRVTRRRDY
jgi:Domain of unknown function (DUF6458)